MRQARLCMGYCSRPSTRALRALLSAFCSIAHLWMWNPSSYQSVRMSKRVVQIVGYKRRQGRQPEHQRTWGHNKIDPDGVQTTQYWIATVPREHVVIAFVILQVIR